MQCGRISATRTFITQLGERDARHMIIGPGCSSGAVTVAENAPFRSLTQVSISIILYLAVVNVRINTVTIVWMAY